MGSNECLSPLGLSRSVKCRSYYLQAKSRARGLAKADLELLGYDYLCEQMRLERVMRIFESGWTSWPGLETSRRLEGLFNHYRSLRVMAAVIFSKR